MFSNIKNKKASLTVETALVLPLFLFCLINIMSLFEMIRIHAVLDAALNQAGKELSTYANMQDIYEVDFLSEVYIKERIVNIVGRDVINNSAIVGGTTGIILWRSEMQEDNDIIDLVMTYRVKPWLPVFDSAELVLMNRCYIKAYTGYENPDIEEADKTYYVAENGVVYHTNRSCTHLQLNISRVGSKELALARNLDGEIYKSCEICCGEDGAEESVYIALQGNRYHTSVSCPGLKRTVYLIKETQINGRPMCTRCLAGSGL